MKNIHVLPTDKPSRLAYYQESTSYNKPILQLVKCTSSDYKYQNIYITNDEKIKEGDYFYQRFDCIIHKCYKLSDNYIIAEKPSDYPKKICKKITLTTDQDLIKDGVQAIDDEFLKWFVKNTSCEEVEVIKYEDDNSPMLLKYKIYHYKIIIPKEEPKLQCKDCNENLTDCTCIEDTVDMKQETLELLEVQIPIENKGVSSWNKSNTTPEFDGEYLFYISCREECGNVHRYYKVVSNSFNTWLINENERVALWKKLPKNPFND